MLSQKLWKSKLDRCNEDILRMQWESSDCSNLPFPIYKFLFSRGLLFCSDRLLNSEKYFTKFLHSCSKTPSFVHGVKTIFSLLKMGKKIRLFSDMDVDGIMSAVIWMKGIKKVCAALEIPFLLDYDIPDRIADGYGANVRMVEEAYKDGVEVIITADNGISSFEACKRAKELGMKFIVTDHHEIPLNELGERLLVPADCIIDPKYEWFYPSQICGAMLSFYVIHALMHLAYVGHDPDSLLHDLAPYAAIATIADVVDLNLENRGIVKWGLSVLRKSLNLPIVELCSATQVSLRNITSSDIGFKIGPCLNASGRLGTSKLAVELFLSDDRKFIAETVKTLVRLNDERKKLTNAGYTYAVNYIEGHSMQSDNVLVLNIPDLHESVAGIVAGKIKEKYKRPAIVLCRSKADSNILKGSGRSVEAYDMFSEVSKVKSLTVAFGGHPMACGISLMATNFTEFRESLLKECALNNSDINIDKVADFSCGLGEVITDSYLDAISSCEPFGKTFEKPVIRFDSMRVSKVSFLGKDNKFLKVRVTNGTVSCDMLVFSDAEDFRHDVLKKYGATQWQRALDGKFSDIKVAALASLEFNYYGGNKTIQLLESDIYVYPDEYANENCLQFA